MGPSHSQEKEGCIHDLEEGDGQQMAPLGTQNKSIRFPDTEKLSLSGNVSDCEKCLTIQLSIKHSLKIFLVPGFVLGGSR